jgi:short-subunit dehydrogenase involved in D-alanine esterification of teichoic acids
MFSARVLAGKKILITGRGSGIGKSLGTRFLELGAEIAICGRREEVLLRK